MNEPDTAGTRNVRINRAIVEAFNRGGVEETRDWFDEAVSFEDPDLPEPIVGRDALLAHQASMLEGFDTMRVTEVDQYPQGDKVLSVVRTLGSGEGTRGEMEIGVVGVHLTTFEDGKVVRWQVFPDAREGFVAAGLDPDDPGEPAG